MRAARASRRAVRYDRTPTRLIGFVNDLEAGRFPQVAALRKNEDELKVRLGA